jgi:HAD superfamily hydrolase (TIGR01509 family)
MSSSDVKHPRAVIFDLDGTLADTFPLIVSSWNAAVREPLHRTFSAEEVIARFGPTECDMLRKELPPDAVDRAIDKFRQAYETDHKRLVKVFDGVPEMLAELSRRAIPIGVMTGKGRDTADITLRKLGWTKLFASVITGDECPSPKPAADGPLMVARELAIAPAECIFVGDAPADIRAGRAAGMSTAWAAWHPIYAEQVRALRPDLVVENPTHVVRLLG